MPAVYPPHHGRVAENLDGFGLELPDQQLAAIDAPGPEHGPAQPEVGAVMPELGRSAVHAGGGEQVLRARANSWGA